MAGLFGSIPSLPPWHRLNLGSEQSQAIESNVANAPEAARLANLTEEQILSMLSEAIPGFGGMRTQISKNIGSELKGEIPQDVQDAIQNSATAKALGGGFGGSGMHSDLVARDLGLTSLSLMDRGLGAAESWLASTERMLSPAIAEFTNMFVTPSEQASFDVNERNMQFAHDWLGSQLSSMPDPTVSGTVGLITGAGDAARGNSTGGFGQQQANRSQSTPQFGNENNFSGKNAPGQGGYDSEAMGWETANSAGYYGFDAGGGSSAAGAGVSGGVDWSAFDASLAGALA